MSKLTVTVEEEVLRQARIRALELGTSVNALVRTYLRHLAERSAAAEGIAEFFKAIEDAGADSGPVGRTWSRAETYRE
jgi:hypothetical protein